MNTHNQNEIDRIVKELCNVLGCSFLARFRKVELLEGKDIIEIATRFLWKIDESNKTIIPTHVIPSNVGDKVEIVNRIADLLKKSNIETDYHVLMHGRTSEVKNLCLAFVEKLPTRCINVPLFEVLHIALYMKDNIVDSADAMKSRYIRRDLTHLRTVEPENVSMRCRKCGPRLSSGREEIINILNGPFGSYGLFRDGRLWCDTNTNNRVKDNDDESLDGLGCLGKSAKKNTLADRKFEEEIDKVVAEMVRVGRYDPTDHTEHIQDLEAEVAEKNAVLKLAENNRNCLFLEIGNLKKYKEENEDLVRTFKDGNDADTKIHSLLCDFWVREIDVKEQWTQTLAATLAQINNLKKKESYILKRPFLEDIAKIEEQIRNMTDLNNIREDSLPLMKKIVREVPENCTTREDLFARLDEVRENYGKQRKALDKIQLDIDVAKKELAWLSESLVRSFNIIEEELFKYAEAIKGEESYRLFTKVNLACLESIETVKSSGELERELERVKNRCLELRNAAKPNDLSLDIEAIRDENDALELLLKKAVEEKKARKDLKRKHSEVGDQQDMEQKQEKFSMREPEEQNVRCTSDGDNLRLVAPTNSLNGSGARDPTNEGDVDTKNEQYEELVPCEKEAVHDGKMRKGLVPEKNTSSINDHQKEVSGSAAN